MYVAYGLYAATGEGLSVWITVANSPEVAEAFWKQKVDKYFHPALEPAVRMDEAPEWVLGRIPPYLAVNAAEDMPCHIEHFFSYHTNCS